MEQQVSSSFFYDDFVLHLDLFNLDTLCDELHIFMY